MRTQKTSYVVFLTGERPFRAVARLTEAGGGEPGLLSRAIPPGFTDLSDTRESGRKRAVRDHLIAAHTVYRQSGFRKSRLRCVYPPDTLCDRFDVRAMGDITQLLRTLRRRMTARVFLERLTFCMLTGGVLVVMVSAASLLLGHQPWNGPVTLGFFGCAVLTASIWTWWQSPTLVQAAAGIDRIGRTKDRFLTAFSFSRVQTPTLLQVRALEECGSYIRGFDFRSLTRVRVPREAGYLLIPLIAMFLMNWHAQFTREITTPVRQVSSELLNQSHALEDLAGQLSVSGSGLNSGDLQHVAEEMKKSAVRLKTPIERTSESHKMALRELSALEAMIQEMQARTPPSAEELAALAEALKQVQSTRDAAAALQAGNLAEAADRIEKAVRQMKKGDAETGASEQVALALREAASRLTGAQKGGMTQQMADGGRSGAAANEAMQRFAEQLRQMADSLPKQGSGNDRSKMLQAALQNLRDMKLGMVSGASASSGNVPKTAATDSKTQMQTFMRQDGQPDSTNPGAPSGQAGGEHDPGTTRTPFGKAQPKNDSPGEGSQLTGLLGSGESLQDLVTTTGGNSKAQRRYRELYDAMMPAAEDAVLQEDIPLGKRFLVKRYFEGIRPAE